MKENIGNDYVFYGERNKENDYFVKRGIKVGNKGNAYFLRWEWRETKRILIL
jgi:hypothetical protein